MIRYIGKRLLTMIPILLVVAILIFCLMDFVPGDPVQIMMGDSATPAQIEEARERLGLNDPFVVRLGNYLWDLLHLDFGKSYIFGMAVGPELLSRFPRTLTLALLCVGASVVIGVPIGISCAMNANKPIDRIWMFLTLLGNSMPGFWLALMLVILVSLRWGLLPSNGIGSWEYYVLPVIANSLGSFASIARQTRSSMLEVIRQDYIRTARSKGLAERKVYFKHMLKNGLIPIITGIGARLARLLGGSMIVENVFSIPGMGVLARTAVMSKDVPLIQAIVLLTSMVACLAFILTDIAYTVVDPRITLTESHD